MRITPCGGLGDGQVPLWDDGRDEEFMNLTHDHGNCRHPCLTASGYLSATCLLPLLNHELSLTLTLITNYP